ncbi:spermidine/putrescine import ATP-binding protein PotA [Litchfieldella qijiaojingensis]|uniref:Spermidine/putrescine import ATP-binding protein PotA n=1 Tax=Litchfieldella qijiaojingensis TaxID=980347 RepID=A0ABQ2YNE0_9GAMM|nr:polyamine ABC transporter ATP-binding protein [Halomonas qijiaojingensis]GGX89201.1 spermidine/putrescine import ATP-binding protein PotA [Halomonas qijiaojingensis]
MKPSSATAPVVEIRRATKRFRTPEGQTVHALAGIDLSVNPNEFVTLLGPSGCGKTTLLRTISGFEALDDGSIHIQGRAMNHIPPHSRPVNTVFQNYALFPHLSVGDNVGYGLAVRKVPRREREMRVGEALEMVGMNGMQQRSPGQLSGGQQQRVALARAIVNRPALLLLDEPLSALDRHLRQTMQRELKSLQSELGIAFVFVTHDQEEALTMSDRIVVLNGGHIQQEGSPSEIYNRPVNTFVAEFIGESNRFQGMLEPFDGQFSRLRLEDGDTLTLMSPASGAADALHVMLRPEQFCVHKPTEAAEEYASLCGRLAQKAFVGRDMEITLETASGRPIKAALRGHDSRTLAERNVGDEVTLWYATSAPHVIAA